MAQNPQKLDVYRESFEFANDCFTLLDEVQGRFRLKEQLFGSTSSVPANLAEFAAFDNVGQQKEKVVRCIAETNETDMWLEMCQRQGLITEEQYKPLAWRNKAIRMKLYQLKKSLG